MNFTTAQNMTRNGREDRHPIEDEYNFHDASFRRHFQLHYGDGSHDYETVFAPAYRYGYELSNENPNRSWEQVENEAQQHWASKHASRWEEVAEAVRYGWNEERNPDKLRVHYHGQFDDYQPAFRRHYADTLPGTGMTFERFEPVYRYGYTLAIDPDYRSRLWSDVEPEVRTMWENEYRDQYQWEDYRRGVSHAWHEVRTRSS